MNFMLNSLIILILLLHYCNADDVESLIETAGYKSETHKVVTEDGYKLKVHRIKAKVPGNMLGPVFFMHGMLASASDYLVLGGKKAFPFLLSDSGFDIWFGNSRGNDNSLKHQTLKTDTNEYWDFSWHEIGYYDLPAMIDYMLNETKSLKTYYVGHSQGCTSLAVLLSTRPEYNAKIIQAHLMAPAVFMANFPHAILRSFLDIVGKLADDGNFNIVSNSRILNYLNSISRVLCADKTLSSGVCAASVSFICGENKGPTEIDPDILPDLLTHLSHAISLKQMSHYLQIYKSGRFQKYDFKKRNKAVYNASLPPAYDLKQMVAPTYIYSGACDSLVSIHDIEHLRNVLPNVREYRRRFSSHQTFHCVADKLSQIINNSGYCGECYKVKTNDGYILKVHRVKAQNNLTDKGTVFLMHGLFRDSSDYLAAGPKVSLPYYLADHGYDVWLGNARGTKHSNEHEKYLFNCKEFWKFSFHEIGLFDLPAMLNFVFDYTKDSKTFYVGHSQGGSSLLALLSSLPKYNEKIIQAHLLTPAAFMKNSTMVLQKISDKIGKVNISPILKLSKQICYLNGYNHETAMKIYKNVTCSIVGKNKHETQVSEEALKIFQDNMSPTVSAMQLMHFLQLHISGKFQQYDYGERNWDFYKSQKPPEYQLSKVTTPVYLYSASEDALIVPSDVEHLKTILPNVKNHEVINDWNHLDVVLGKNSRKSLYKNILRSMTMN
ncbi:CLUMA_CG007852, isoform A [Clunio marinus]|uniref:CLUMA_CG007852, isoform A n=1 Tax=Clunio marinus TaxID=568069 RepID=A0A1J1I7E6_9DIPT|nr:CLUMA_CG007852, isoform A [Clunio marinus]